MSGLMIGAGSRTYAPSSSNQSILSLVSVKEDARDLLEKYSELLMQEVVKKL